MLACLRAGERGIRKERAVVVRRRTRSLERDERVYFLAGFFAAGEFGATRWATPDDAAAANLIPCAEGHSADPRNSSMQFSCVAALLG